MQPDNQNPQQQPQIIKPTNPPEPTPAPPDTAGAPTPVTIASLIENNVWIKTIPITNYVSVAISLCFLLFVDTPILVQSPELAAFYVLMIIAISILVVCTIVEYLVGQKIRYLPASTQDRTVAGLVIARNVILILNMIPFIQLLGLLGGVTVLPILIIIEIVLVMKCLQQLPRL